MKYVRILSLSGPYCPAFGLKRTRKAPNTDTFHAVIVFPYSGEAVSKLMHVRPIYVICTSNSSIKRRMFIIWYVVVDNANIINTDR